MKIINLNYRKSETGAVPHSKENYQTVRTLLFRNFTLYGYNRELFKFYNSGLDSESDS